MSAPEIARLAAALPVPVEPPSGRCRAYVAEERDAWRLAFARDGGRIREFAGPAFSFDRAGGRRARAFVELVNGETPRRDQQAERGDDIAAGLTGAPLPGGGVTAAGDGPEPVVGSPSTAGVIVCAGCDGPIPPGRH